MRPVDEILVVDRALARFKDDVDCFVVIDADDGLAAGQQILVAATLLVIADSVFVAAGEKAHTTGLLIGVAERHPEIDRRAPVKPVIGSVLMIGDKSIVARLFVPDHRDEQQDVGPDNVFHHIKNAWITGDFQHPGQDQVGFYPQNLPGFLAGFSLESLDTVTNMNGFSRGHHPDTRHIAIALILPDLFGAQHLRHGLSS